ncbi:MULTISPECIES: signal peptidase I [Clostridia]|uniref:signal peptidase I n=1 Tax=Clostridia TaxID=186801 RepID=UPI0015F9082F|nr:MULTISPECIES: signal peptidase I [Clostridia]
MPSRIKKRKYKKQGKYILSSMVYFLLEMLALFFLLLIFSYVIGGQVRVFGVSMTPRLVEGDRLVYRKLSYEPQRGDVVICRTGKGFEYELVKRIIGIPGDKIEIDASSGLVHVNDEVLDEPYCSGGTYLLGDISYPLTVPPGQYFVMGDNRQESIDSRYSEIGTIEEDKIDGQVIFRIYPFNKIGKID